MVENGSWNFLGKYDEYKNKERVVFNATDVATTSQTNVHTVTDDGSGTTSEEHTMGDTYKNNYTMGNGESPMIFAIDQLKGKEIIMIQESSGTTQNSVTSGSITETSNYSDQNSLSMTLTQK
jgi:hypothetical protein